MSSFCTRQKTKIGNLYISGETHKSGIIIDDVELIFDNEFQCDIHLFKDGLFEIAPEIVLHFDVVLKFEYNRIITYFKNLYVIGMNFKYINKYKYE